MLLSCIILRIETKSKEKIMYNVELTDKCEDLGLVPYEDICERRTRPNTAVENEMTRHSLEIAVKEGWVKSFSKIEYTTLEA